MGAETSSVRGDPIAYAHAITAMSALVRNPACERTHAPVLEATWGLVKPFLPPTPPEFIEYVRRIRLVVTADIGMVQSITAFGLFSAVPAPTITLIDMASVPRTALRALLGEGTPAVLTSAATWVSRTLLDVVKTEVIILAHELVHAWQAFNNVRLSRGIASGGHAVPGRGAAPLPTRWCVKEAHATRATTRMAAAYGMQTENTIGLRLLRALTRRTTPELACYYAFLSDADNQLLDWWESLALTGAQPTARLQVQMDAGTGLPSGLVRETLAPAPLHLWTTRDTTRVLGALAALEAEGAPVEAMRREVARLGAGRADRIWAQYQAQRPALLGTALRRPQRR
jgi:hypothetical protein